MKYSVSGFFQLILRILPKLTLNIINKNLRTLKIFTKKDFELKLYDKGCALVIVLVLSPSEVDEATKKYGSKKSMVYPYCA